MDTRAWLEYVFGAGEGQAVVTLRNPTTGKPTDDNFYLYPDEIDLMVEYIDAHNEQDVYYSPVLYNQSRRLKQNSKTVSVAYSDADACAPSNYRVAPSAAVETSPGRWHVYWVLDGDYNPHTVALLNRRMAQAHKHQGADVNFGNMAKLLRVPGTANVKHVAVVQQPIINGAIYSLAELEAAYPVGEFPEKVYAIDRPMPQGLPSRTQLLSEIPNDRTIKELLFKDNFDNVDRSSVRYKLESELFRAGYAPEEILTLVWDAPCCKYKQEGRPIEQLWKEVLIAEVDPRNQPPVFDPNDPIFESDNQPLVVLQTKLEPINLLTDDERDSLTVRFPDEWVAWAKTKTTSHPKYHRMSALMAMSAVYSEFGYVPLEFTNMLLNIWAMLLGNTTLDRKTTAKDYMIDILEALETPDFQYNIGTDATQQGLNKALADKPHQASLLHKDEVQGFFKELFTQSFLSGLVEYFTELYSGKSRGTLRSTGDKQIIKAVPTSFLLYLMGITEEATELLTVKHFKSGFLTRFIYSVVEPTPYDPKKDLVRQAPIVQGKYVDPVRNGLIKSLAIGRNHWEMKGTRDNKQPIRLNQDALDRFNEFRIYINEVIANMPQVEILRAPIERLTISVIKVAGLFAMHDRSSTITLDHMLAAIHYCEEWYDDLIKISTMVSESIWQREVGQLEAFIVSKGGKATWESCYKQFPDKLPQDFRIMVQALEDRGVLIQHKMGIKMVLEINYGSNATSIA